MVEKAQTTVAVIGLGNMGLPMANNLAGGGYRVRGFDLSADRMRLASEGKVDPANSAADAVRDADVIITMLPAAPFVSKVWDEVVPLARRGALIIDSSTSDVATTRKLHAQAESAGLRSLDAPVSGGTVGAEAGSLTFMVGGAAEVFEAARPLLECMGNKAVHCGGAGTGQAAKICNNMILGVSIIAVSEAFVLGEKLGLSPQALFDVASTSTGQCWSLNTYCPVPGLVPTSPANRDYKPGAPATMLLKDLRLSHEAAQSVEAHTALGDHATEIFQAFVDAGHGAQDFSAIIRQVRSKSAGGQ